LKIKKGSFTWIAPIRAVENCVIIHSIQFGDHNATLSPFLTPNETKPAANFSAYYNEKKTFFEFKFELMIKAELEIQFF
jgi:hypothetical protein